MGPKINGNADGHRTHLLIRHGAMTAPDAPRTFEGLRFWLSWHAWEGVVFHHPDGRMCKIRRDDFGLPWPMPRLGDLGASVMAYLPKGRGTAGGSMK